MKQRSPVKKRIVVIRFLDHMSHCASADEIVPLECEVVGYLIHEDDRHYRVMVWISGDNLNDDNNEGYAILKSTVTRFRRVE